MCVRQMTVWVFRSSWVGGGKCIFGEAKRASKGLLMCQIHKHLVSIYCVPEKTHI